MIRRQAKAMSVLSDAIVKTTCRRSLCCWKACFCWAIHAVLARPMFGGGPPHLHPSWPWPSPRTGEVRAGSAGSAEPATPRHPAVVWRSGDVGASRWWRDISGKDTRHVASVCTRSPGASRMARHPRPPEKTQTSAERLPRDKVQGLLLY